DEHTVESRQLCGKLGGVRVDDGDVVRAQPAAVLLELPRATGMELYRDDLAGELRCLAARRGAQVEGPFSRLRADRQPGELRAAALRPVAPGRQRALVDQAVVMRV